MATVAQSAPYSTMHHRPLYALLGGFFFFLVALPAPDLVSGVIPYLLEGHYTFAFKSMRAMTVAEMFVFIIAARSLLVWGYAGWAKQRGLFSVRMSLMRPDAAWCLAAALATLEKALLAFEPTSRTVPTTSTRITASITAYPAMS